MNIVFNRIYCHEAYGLNKYRALLKAKNDIYIDDLDQFAFDILYEDGYIDGAIFAHTLDNMMYAYVYDYDQEAIMCYDCCGFDSEFFISVDADYQCSYYCLLIETESGLWRIVDE